MSDFLAGLERDLVDAAARAVAAPRGERRRRPLRRLPALALVVLAALVLAAVAFAAQRLIVGTGAPVPTLPAPPLQPHSDRGLIVPGSPRLLGLRAADPDGGPPWGVRETHMSRGVGCLQIGRVVDGRLGVLGIGGAFGDDHLFHPLRVRGQQGPLGCLTLDADDRLFLNVAAIGIPASGAGSGAASSGACDPLGGGDGAARRGRCASAAWRDVYVGLLGPLAASITYRDGDDLRTVPTVGPEGAYLIVTRGAPGPRGGIMPGAAPTNGPIVRVTYRDGVTCRIGRGGPLDDARSCPPRGYRPPPLAHVTHADVAAPVHARLVTRHGRRVIVVRFTARVAVHDARSAYAVTLHRPSADGRPGMFTPSPTRSDIAAGATVTKVFGARRPGVYRGTVAYTPAPAKPETPWVLALRGGVPVGRFVVRVP